jgi:hypothetical protein
MQQVAIEHLFFEFQILANVKGDGRQRNTEPDRRANPSRPGQRIAKDLTGAGGDVRFGSLPLVRRDLGGRRGRLRIAEMGTRVSASSPP